MKTSARMLRGLHIAILAVMALLTIPVLGSLFMANMTPGAARVMESVMPVWGWMVGAWAAAVVYFCCCLVLSMDFREALLARVSGLSERDEREELVTAKAARSVFLVTLAGFLAAGLLGMIRFNIFTYTRWEGESVPPLTRVGPYELRKGTVAKRGFLMWPSLGLPMAREPQPASADIERGSTQYSYEGGSIFEPEVARTFFALALIQVLLLHLFARRVRV
jgi:hypothetical protein